MKQVTAARKLIKTLEIEPEDQALAEMVLGLAKAVDEDPQNAALWREFRSAMVSLREATTPDTDDDARAFLYSIKTPRVRPEMGNTKEQSA